MLKSIVFELFRFPLDIFLSAMAPGNYQTKYHVLQLPVGGSALRDPWGVPPVVVPDSDGQAARVQISVPSRDESEDQILARDLTTGKVTVTGKLLLDSGEDQTIVAVMLVPDPQSSLTNLVVLDDEDPKPDSFLFSNVPVGLRAVVATVNDRMHIHYVQVPHSGASLVFNCKSGVN